MICNGNVDFVSGTDPARVCGANNRCRQFLTNIYRLTGVNTMTTEAIQTCKK